MSKKNQSLDTGESKKQFINIAQVPQYQPEIESFENYSDRLTAFLEVNKVTENEKISTLIAVISAEAYVILKDNVYPEKPVNKKYVDLIEVLKKHYSETLILSDRLKFNRRSQLPMETVAEYIQVLRQMASNCNYGEFLDEALRDRLIAGLNDVFLIKKLLSQPTNMTFTQASKICFNYETSSELNLRKNEELVQILPNTSKVKSQQNQQGLKILKAKSNVRRPINKSSHVRCREHGANRCPVRKKQWLHFQCGKKGNVSTIYRTKDNIKSIRRKNENQPKTIITADNVKSIQGVNGDQTNTIETEDNVKSIQRENENQPNTIITADNEKSIQGINEDQSNTIKTEDNVKSIQRENENQPNTIIIADNGKSYPLISKEMINDRLSLSGLDTVSTRTMQNQQLVPCERQNIWQGIVEWIEKAKNPTDAQKQTRHVPCQVSANAKDGDPELKADTWPPKLIMQLMPKQLIGSIGGTYLKNSKSVVFHPTPCEALESLTKMMTAGFAGCVHFTSASSSPACEIKVLILLYTTDKKTYLGFIPNDQTAFVDRLRKVIQQQKTSQNASARQANPGPGNPISAPMPTTGTQGGILMSQTNTMAMGGGQITQNVVSTAPPQTLTSTSGPQTQMNMQNSGIGGPQANAGAGGMIGQQRPPFDDIEIARHQNLLKIQHLRQTLEAAQQQEAQYKSQLEVNIQQNLEVAQQQEMQYKQQLEAQQAQQRGINPAAMANQQAGAQRLMRPVTTNNLGLRHLLQQPQPQYSVRQVFGVQQQMVGPRGQIATRPMAPGNAQNQQFEDVSSYDFLS